MTEPACAWVTCDDALAEPGSLFCHEHSRAARAEGAPWRRPGVEVERRPAPPEARAEPRLQPSQATCRRPGCDEPCLEKTIGSRSNRWRNLCDAHYREARLGALGARRREQVVAVSPPVAAANGHPASYAARAAELLLIARELDDAIADCAEASMRLFALEERWREIAAGESA